MRIPSNPGNYRFETMGAGGDTPRAYLFGNFKCPWTREFARGNLHDVIREFVNPGDLQLQYLNVAYEPDHHMGRPSPTHGDGTYFISNSDPRIARVALGAWEVDPDGYWGFFQDMFETPPSGWVTYEDLYERLRASGVSNRDEIIARAKTDRYEDELRAAEDAAEDFAIEATPRLAFRGETVNPHHGAEELLDWIAARLPKSGSGSAGASTDSTGGGVGAVRQHQPAAGTWHDVGLSGHDTPTVVMGPASVNGAQPVHPRVRAVGDDGFQFKLEEWQYLDGVHFEETVGHLSFSAGTHALPGGAAVDAGRVATDHNYTRVGFDADFDTEPAVFTQVMSYAGYDPAVARQANATADGVSVRVQEAESGGPHAVETVGYVAVSRGRTTVGGGRAEAGRAPDVTDEWHWINFSRDYDAPAFVASIHTANGADTAALRYKNLSAGGVHVRIQEERSEDGETNHAPEDVSYLVAEQ